ncbi:hypothetical protein U9M48_041847 [Paspalum notatum var. saurae]|uniref:Thioesterase domain-containing protein n=1 Tax=Paspalum notatum var. saurae TaxID=547442 RepID=A0AAQ3XEN7_PASNO
MLCYALPPCRPSSPAATYIYPPASGLASLAAHIAPAPIRSIAAPRPPAATLRTPPAPHRPATTTMAAGKDDDDSGGGSNPPTAAPPPADKALESLGFEFTGIGAREVAGRLPVTATCCQPFGLLNGGVTALVAESAASVGAYVASGGRRVAAVQLSVNHLCPARLGDVVRARAAPLQLGRTIQVWEVQIWRMDPSSTPERKDQLVSTARVTLLISNPSKPEDMTSHEASIKKYAKL